MALVWTAAVSCLIDPEIAVLFPRWFGICPAVVFAIIVAVTTSVTFRIVEAICLRRFDSGAPWPERALARGAVPSTSIGRGRLSVVLAQ